MTISIPDKIRKPLYWLALVAGIIGAVVAWVSPDVAATVTDRLTGISSLVGSAGAVAALIHFTSSGDGKAAAAVPQDDFTDDAAQDTGA